jgi:hypothetical protein
MASDDVMIEVPFGFRGEVLLKGKRKTRDHILSDKVLVSIPSLSDAEAPRVVRSKEGWIAGNEARVSGAGFLTPVCVYSSPMTIDNMAEFLSGSRSRSDDGGWYPFPTGHEGMPRLNHWLRGREEDDRDIFDTKRFRIGSEGIKDWDHDLRAAAVAECHRIAAEGVAFVDGVLHRSCPMPVLEVNPDSTWSSIGLSLDGKARPRRVRVQLSDLGALLSDPTIAASRDVQSFVTRHEMLPVPETSFDVRRLNAANLAESMAVLLAKRHSEKTVADGWGWKARAYSREAAGRLDERISILKVAAAAVRCERSGRGIDELWAIAAEEATKHEALAAEVAAFEEVFSIVEAPSPDSLPKP